MLFENCLVTNSICAPSRAVILTGKHSHVNGVRDNRVEFNAHQQTFPKLLQQAGYQTALIGKWHLKSEPIGFDYFDILPGQGQYYNPDFINAEGRYRVEGYCTDIITEKAVDWLEDRNEDEPFMLMVQHKAPHRQWQPAPRHFSLFKNDVPEPVDLFDDWQNRNSGAAAQEMSIKEYLRHEYDLKIGKAPQRLNEQQKKLWDAYYQPHNQWFAAANLAGDALTRYYYQRYIKDYLRCVQAVDDGIGDLLDTLAEQGMDENTIVIYASDQGFYLGDYGWYDKRWMYEPSLKTPLVVKWPGVTKPGSRNENIVLNLDFAQTFLEMAQTKQPSDMQGRSLVPLLAGKDVNDWRRSMYYHYFELGEHNVPRHFGVRTDRFKLIRYYDLDEWELFDLQTDPREKMNLYDNVAYRSIRSRMMRLLEAERLAAGDADAHSVAAYVGQ